jgi:lipoate-protein ligase A
MRIDRHDAACAAGEQLRIEQEIFDSLAGARPQLRLWQPLPALIVTLAEANQPNFAVAAARATARGIPVEVRRSGGGAVCLGYGMWVVSHFYTSKVNEIDSSYRHFADALIGAIVRVGITLADGQVAGAYCDGKFDLAWRGMKVCGMAQRRRWRDGKSHVWIHAVLAVEQEALRYPAEVARFYSDLGSSRVADPDNTTCLWDCLPMRAREPELLRRCGDAIATAFETQPDP